MSVLMVRLIAALRYSPDVAHATKVLELITELEARNA